MWGATAGRASVASVASAAPVAAFAPNAGLVRSVGFHVGAALAAARGWRETSRGPTRAGASPAPTFQKTRARRASRTTSRFERLVGRCEHRPLQTTLANAGPSCSSSADARIGRYTGRVDSRCERRARSEDVLGSAEVGDEAPQADVGERVAEQQLQHLERHRRAWRAAAWFDRRLRPVGYAPRGIAGRLSSTPSSPAAARRRQRAQGPGRVGRARRVPGWGP